MAASAALVEIEKWDGNPEFIAEATIAEEKRAAARTAAAE